MGRWHLFWLKLPDDNQSFLSVKSRAESSIWLALLDFIVAMAYSKCWSVSGD